MANAKIDDWQEVPMADPGDWQEVPVEAEKPGVMETMAHAGGQGLTFGFSDEIGGGVRAAMGKLGGSDEDYADLYAKYRDEQRAAQKAAEAAHPGIYKTTEIGGALLPALVTGGSSLAPSLARAAVVGMSGGALSGLGHSEAKDARGLATDTALGGAMGAVGGAAGHGITKAIGHALPKPAVGELSEMTMGASKVPAKVVGGDFAEEATESGLRPVMREMPQEVDISKQVSEYLTKKFSPAGEKLAKPFDYAADSFAVRALGAEKGTVKQLGKDRVQELGRYANENKLLSPFASTEKVMSRNQGVQQNAGGMLDEVYGAIDDANLSTFNPMDVAAKVENKVGDFWRSPINRAETNQLDNTLATITDRGETVAAHLNNGNIPLSWARTLKSDLGKVAKWKNNLPISDKEQMARDAYGVVSDEIQNVATTGAKSLGRPELSQKLSEGNRLYSLSKDADKLLENKFAREQGNKMFGLTDSIAGAGSLGYGYTTNDWETAGAIFAGKKGLEKYGAQTAAIGLNKIGDLVKSAPQAFGKYAGQLTQAAERGPQALGAAHYLMWNRDPEYRTLMEKNLPGGGK